MRLALALAAAVLAACAHAPRGPALARVEAEGWAPLAADGEPGARRRALADAQRAAVEKAVGVRLSARTRVDGAVAVEQRVEARAAGSVRSYEVLSESDADGFHRTRIRALVEVGVAPRGDDAALPPPGDPRVAVRLSGPDAVSATAGVRRALLARGWTVVDGEKADWLVVGEAASRELGGIGPFSSWRARASLTLRRPSDGRVLAQSSREASAADPAPSAAGARAAELAGELAAEALKGQAFGSFENAAR
ncbi:MAG: hypothetical protein HY079_06810 [Elusimicrobia bacterium]|nr:hypothetical protein [Elusimicrobiota bacterium]